MFREQFNNYDITEQEIMKQYGMNRKQFTIIMEEGNYYEDRAKFVIEKFNKQQIDEKIPPVIRVGITKLSLIHFIAGRLPAGTVADLTALEKIENNSIKALMYSNTLWGNIANTEAVEVTPSWYVIMESSSLDDLLLMSNALRDKILLRDKVDEVKIYHSWDDHVVNCRELNIDPKLYTEQEVAEMQDKLKRYKGMVEDE